jgi:hypothetical protein
MRTLFGELERLKAWFSSKFIIKGTVKFCASQSFGYYTGTYFKGRRVGYWTWYVPHVDTTGVTMRIEDIKVKEEYYTNGNLNFTWYR